MAKQTTVAAWFKDHRAYKYAKSAISPKSREPTYIKKQYKKVIQIAEGKNKKYIINKDIVELIDGVLKLLVMPVGKHRGKTMYEALAGFQIAFIIFALCTVHADNPQRRKYNKAILEIARKNGKTLVVAVIFIIEMLLEPRFSKLYSVAPDGSLSREIKEAMENIIKSSPALFDEADPERIFKIRRDNTDCKLTETKYIPLNYSNSRLDGKMPQVFVVDEVGALPNAYAIEAMQSGQATVDNPLGFVISTKYPKIDNPFEDEIQYSKRVLDDLVEDETIFTLLYEPDNIKDWQTDDLILEQANPLAREIKEVMDYLKGKRARAIELKSARENFLTKHCNIIYQGIDVETYVDINELRKCKVKHKIIWTGRSVYLGLDLAITTDNVSYTMSALDEQTGKILLSSKAFIPIDRINSKTIEEKLDYNRFIREGHCVACGDSVVDYNLIEKVIMCIEEEYKVHVLGIGYDLYNALSTAQKLEAEGYKTIQIKQHSSVLHAPTKLLKEYILSQKVEYEDNLLYEVNFQNAKVTYDTNLNMYVNKKKSTGKVDMVISTIMAVLLLMDNEILNQGEDWSIQLA